MSGILFDGSTGKRSAAVHDANKQAQASKERNQVVTDQYNGKLLRTDPLLARLMAAYTRCDEANRAEVVRLAELACAAPGGIV